MGVLQDYREQYPQYADIDDDQLLQSLYQTYYADEMDEQTFREQLGYTEPEPVEPDITEKVDTKLASSEQRLKEPMAEPSPFQPEEKGFVTNVIDLMGQRLLKLGGGFLEAVSQVATSPLADLSDDPEAARKLDEASPVFRLGKYLKGVDLGGRKQHGPEEVTKAFQSGDVSDTLKEVLLFGIETGVESVPDMIFVMRTMPLYVTARAREMGEIRAKHKGKDRAGVLETYESVPYALGSAMLEKFGAKGILEAGKDIATEVGKSALKQGLKNVAKGAATATARESGTEAMQEGIIEYIGERWGTEQALDWKEGAIRGAWGALAGGVFGGVAGAGVAAGSELTRAYDERTEIPPEFAEPPPRALPSVPAEPEPKPPPTPPPAPEDQLDALVEQYRREFIGQGAIPGDSPRARAQQRLLERIREAGGDPDELFQAGRPAPEPTGGVVANEAYRTALEAAKLIVTNDAERNQILDIDEAYGLGELSQDEAIAKLREFGPAPEPAIAFDEAIADPTYRAGLEGMLNELMPHGGIAPVLDAEGEQTGRSQSQNPPWVQSIIEEERVGWKYIQKAVQKALAGEDLGAKQQRVVDGMLYVLEEELNPPSNGFTSDEYEGEWDEETKRIFDDAEDLGTEITSIDDFDALLEKAYGTDETGEAGPGAEEAPGEPGEGAPAAAEPEGDLLGDDTKTAQDLADRERELDEARSTGSTNMTGTMFGGDVAQGDIFDTPGVDTRGAGFEITGYRTEGGNIYAGVQVPILGPGLYVATTREGAESFEGEGITEHKVSLENPLIIRTDEEWRTLTREAGWRVPNPSGQSETEVTKLTDTLQKLVRDRGHDGIAVLWDDSIEGDMDSQGNGVKTLRNVFSTPQVVQFQEVSETRSSTQASAVAGTNHVPMIGKTGGLPLTANQEYFLTSKQGPVTIPKRPIRRNHIVKTMEQIFGLHVYQGRIKGKTRLGFYKTKIGEIRTKFHNDLEVTAHEVGHWMDDRYPWIRKMYMRHKGEMKGVSYDETKVFEGYAEFMRLFFTQEHMAYEAAPAFFDEFVAELATKKYGPGIFKVQEMMHAWYLQGARARFASKIGDDALPMKARAQQWRHQIPDKLLMKVFDELRPFKVAERAITGTVGIANTSGYKSLRLARGQRAVMDAVYNFGTIGWDENGDIEFTGDSLKKVFEPVDKLMVEFEQYMIARRAQELTNQGRENLFRPDEINSGLGWAQQYPIFEEVFQDWLDFSARMMDFYEASGIISASKRKMIEEMNLNYVPFNRIIESAEANAAGGTKVAQSTSPFMRLKGGTANVAHPFETIISNTSHLIHMSLVNRGKQNFYDMINRSDKQTGALYAVKVPKDSRPVPITSDQVISTVVEGMGWTMRGYRSAKAMPESEEEQTRVEMIDEIADSMGDFVTFFEVGLAPKGKIDSYLRNGEPVYYEIGDPLLWDAIQHVGPKAHNMAVNMLGGFANLLRAGVTLTPTFQMKNITRDSMNAWTLSKGQMVPVVGATTELVRRMFSDPLYWEYMANGGGFSSMAEADGLNLDSVIKGPKSLLQKYASGMSAFEYANRVAEYKALRKKGYTKREAAFLGREISTDFAMRGSSEALRVLTISIPFMNARLQGNYRIAREIGQMQDGRLRATGKQAFSYALRATLAITIPSLILYAFNKDDERYQELPDHDKDLNWIFIYGPGEDDIFRMPKPFETGMMFGSLPERIFELWEKRDGREFTDAALWLLLESFGLDFVPQMIKPPYDLARNKKFTGAPITPKWMEGIEPGEQYRNYTSDAMVALGRKINYSPIQAEYLVRGYLGTLGVWGLAGADYLVNSAYGEDVSGGGEAPSIDLWRENFLLGPFVQKGPLHRTDSMNDFYEMLKVTRMAVDTIRHLQSASPKRLLDYLSQPEKMAMMGVAGDLEKIAFTTRNLNTKIELIVSHPEMSGIEKRAMIDEILRERNVVYRTSMKAINRQKISHIAEKLPKLKQQR